MHPSPVEEPPARSLASESLLQIYAKQLATDLPRKTLVLAKVCEFLHTRAAMITNHWDKCDDYLLVLTICYEQLLLNADLLDLLLLHAPPTSSLSRIACLETERQGCHHAQDTRRASLHTLDICIHNRSQIQFHFHSAVNGAAKTK